MFEKYSNMKFHENPLSAGRFILCGRTGGQTDITRLILAFRNFMNAPEKISRLIIFRDLLNVIENHAKHMYYGLSAKCRNLVVKHEVHIITNVLNS